MKVYIANSTKEQVKKSSVPTAIKVFDPTTSFSLLTDNEIGSDTNKKFAEFWELMDAIESHGYLRSAMSTIGRSAVSAWWTIAEHPNYQGKGTDAKRKKLFKFYSAENRKWDNIKDYQNIVYKLTIASMYLKFFGQAAFFVVRNELGEPIGLDFLHGMVIPNVDSNGYFKNPAFVQYISDDFTTKKEFKASEIVYIVNPDWRGNPIGGTDIEALTDYTLPTDIYLQTAAREYLKNRDKPEVIYELPADIDDEAFDEFVEILSKKYRGASNIGKSPIAVQGELNIKELSKMPDGLPYQESRADSREELLATTGVNGAKLGISTASKSDLREMRREFHETTMLPIFRAIEQAFYEQIHLREFGVREWMFKFNAPDFLTAVEKATVYMRLHGLGVLSPNEIRLELGRPPREDGDEYFDPNAKNEKAEGEQGSPPEGREDRPDKPSNTGEPTLDDQDPPRGDNHDDEERGLNVDEDYLWHNTKGILDELFKWRDFATKRIKSGNPIRPFASEILPELITTNVNAYLTGTKDLTKESVKSYFDEIIKIVKET